MSEPASPQNVTIPITMEKALTIYANMCRGVMTAEEVILDFALNPNMSGKVLDEPIEVSNRVVMNFATAKRLLHLLHAMVTKHEENFGPVILDINERIKARTDAVAQPQS